MDPVTRSILADVSATFLLTLAFVLLVAASAAMHLLWRGLRDVRRQLPEVMETVEARVAEVEVTTHQTAHGVVEPPIRVASAWAGLKAGAKAFMKKSSEDPDRRPPPL